VNIAERKMLEFLEKGRDKYGVVAVKAEFEAEGTRPDELLRLLDLARRADLKVALKIGGCEAISDLFASLLYGVDYIIAPMVETPYALTKFIEAKAKTHGANEGGAEFLYNLETQTALENLKPMLLLAEGNVDGIVFGRVDFTLSRGMPRDAINDPSVTEAVLTVARACADHDLELVVGGSVAPAAIDALRAFRKIRLDRFETRKIVFDGKIVNSPAIEDAIANAVEFELAWLQNKRDYYQRIGAEDAQRILMMEKRQATTQLIQAKAS
jgi:citrate lyase beta subunit